MLNRLVEVSYATNSWSSSSGGRVPRDQRRALGADRRPFRMSPRPQVNVYTRISRLAAGTSSSC